MPKKIEMSPDFADKYTKRMLGFNAFADIAAHGPWNSQGFPAWTPMLNSYYGMEYGGLSSGACLYIMQGTKPLVTDITSFATISPNVLLTYISSAYPAINTFDGTILDHQTVKVNTSYFAATGTGTATWFLLACRNITAGLWNGTPGPWQDGFSQAIIGTVGTMGSGADLEIPNVDVVTGLPYKVSNLAFRFPTTWQFGPVGTGWDGTHVTGGPNEYVLSSDLSTFTVSPTSGPKVGIKSLIGKTTGKYYAEVKYIASIVGYGTIGINSSANESPGGEGQGFSILLRGNGTGVTQTASASLEGGAAFAPLGTIFKFALDLDTNKFWLGYNDKWFESATWSGVTGNINLASPTFNITGADPFYIFVNACAGQGFELITTSADFIYTPPATFLPWDAA